MMIDNDRTHTHATPHHATPRHATPHKNPAPLYPLVGSKGN